jgi:hypothetical protein
MVYVISWRQSSRVQSLAQEYTVYPVHECKNDSLQSINFLSLNIILNSGL